MVKRGRAKRTIALGDASAPDGFGVWALRYLEALRVRNYSERTVENQESYLALFIAWCEARSVVRPHDVTKPILDRYQRHLFHARKPNGRPLTFASQVRALTPVRGLFKWLTRQNVLLWNPASEIEMPKQERRLPKHVLTIDEAERVLEQADVTDPFGVRDRAILETLYSTGIRRMEVIGLGVFDLDADRGTLMVRQGKGKKDRVVPIGERAALWVQRYVQEVRPELVMPPDDGVLFLTHEGEALSASWLSERVRQYIARAELGKTGSCHLFRHTCATLMLEAGAEIRGVQEMLGHVQLATTQVYTHVSIRWLKTIHTTTHPSARLERVTKVGTNGGSDGAVTGALPSLAASVAAEARAVVDAAAGGPRGVVEPQASASELLEELAAEAEGEEN
jgi:integrase/recombinase XerD